MATPSHVIPAARRQEIKDQLFVGDPPDRTGPGWDQLVREFEDLAGSPICGAKTRPGWPCTQTFLGNGGRCKMHGGATIPAGPGHPSWKHGRASAVASRLPERFRESFKNFVDDPDLLSLRPEIAVVDERFYELLDKLDTGENVRSWTEARDILHNLVDELRQADPDVDTALEMAGDMDRIMRNALKYGYLWSEIQGTTKRREELVTAESKRLKDANAMMAANDVLSIIHQILDRVLKVVHDRQALLAIWELAREYAPDLDELDTPKLPPKAKE